MFEQIKKIVYKVSSVCNLDCSYCFLDAETKTKNLAVYNFDDLAKLVQTLPLKDELEIFITGGEPSLFIDEIRAGIKKVKKIERKQDIKVNFTMITNGTNMEGIIELMDEGLLDPKGVKFSWDGIYSTTQARRPKVAGAYTDEFFNEKLAVLGRSKWTKDVLVRTAVTNETVDDLAASVEYLLSVGVKKWEYYFLIHYPEYKTPEFAARFEKQIEKIGRLFLDRYSDYGTRWTYSSWDSLFFASQVKDKSSCDTMRQGGCADFGYTLYLAYNGLIYPCDMFDQYAFGIKLFEEGEFAIGTIFDGIDQAKLQPAIDKHGCMADGNKRDCEESHCFYCSADNIQVVMGASCHSCDTCGLRGVERRVFDRLTNGLQLDQLEQELYKNKFSFLNKKY